MSLVQKKQLQPSLIHNVSSTGYSEAIYANGLKTSENDYTDATKAVKVRERLFTYSNGILSTETLKQYYLGLLVETETKTLTITNGLFINSNNVVV